MELPIVATGFDWSNPNSYASAAQDWGKAITSVDGMVKGVSATLSANGVAMPSPVAGPVAQNMTPAPSILARIGMPIWAAVTLGVALLLGLGYLLFRGR